MIQGRPSAAYSDTGFDLAAMPIFRYRCGHNESKGE